MLDWAIEQEIEKCMESVTILMPTLATTERGPYLQLAINSVLEQSRVTTIPLVIVNGNNGDPAVIRWLETNRSVRLLRIAGASMPKALCAGWKSVDTPFFGELDDDDELFPDAIRMRLSAFEKTPEMDAVITNGIVRSERGDRSSLPDVESVAADPLRSVLKSNWLLPGSALFCNQRLDTSLFCNIPHYLEWTYIALRLSLGHKLVFLPQKTVLHRANLPFSIDKSAECQIGRAQSMTQLLKLSLPADVKTVLRRKAQREYHCVADQMLTERKMNTAWKWHIRSLMGGNWWRYLGYTRKLLLPR